MQKVIVDTTGALYAAGQLILGLRLGFNGVTAATKARRNSSRRVSRSRPTGEGAAFGPPFCCVCGQGGRRTGFRAALPSF
jgi:hypothetical protein